MTTERQIQLEAGWKSHLLEEFQKLYMSELKEFLRLEIARKKTIYPKGSEYFNAFNSTSFDKVKVVVLGQDPYHGPGQAHGLSFSVPRGVDIPPSLVNIFKEIQTDLGLTQEDFRHGYLKSWADQGVLLLNSVLTVEAGRAASHQAKGWEIFTDRAVSMLNEKKDHLVFMLWGAYAQRKGGVIDEKRHLVLRAPHPSPLSAHRGFLGCRHFSQANAYLARHGRDPIDWRLPD
ncbi:uracil-DNA glycosylase [Citrifermentans bemidjiense Bem]|uniref:Uracil-DNA glycosylase n=1 Tax=Citrifermentans bemidjiense (strain ATCC BAA-1014 / DSM 16622 / JCM 12645 / Bem) TaxID=404380 RepID=B5EET5_CITBB|nr:uracil-DNA glycosylase [Citrifermentans bemidjiense]ACH37831.1 uracil-DNA glycosylase [Citrifermentans bemidjiense Bem]